MPYLCFPVRKFLCVESQKMATVWTVFYRVYKTYFERKSKLKNIIFNRIRMEKTFCVFSHDFKGHIELSGTKIENKIRLEGSKLVDVSVQKCWQSSRKWLSKHSCLHHNMHPSSPLNWACSKQNGILMQRCSPFLSKGPSSSWGASVLY